MAIGYYKDEAEFLNRVEEDATSFKPHGDLIHTYVRPSPSAVGKGKSKSAAALNAQSEDAVVFEVYHVRSCAITGCTRRLIGEYVRYSGHMEYPWFQRVSSPNATVYLTLHRSRLLHQRG